MHKKAQVLIISLWILVILTILAVGIGHRVSMALYLSKYQKDRLKAIYLAKAGINLAILEITEDQTPDSDNLNDKWANNEDTFKKIILNENEAEFATVSYTVKEGDKEETKFGVIDEERKININTASQELLIALLGHCEISAAEEIANNIRIWRGEIPDSNNIYGDLGYPCKAGKFSNIEELKLAKGITPEIYQQLKGLITVYGDGKININTVTFEVLTIFAHGIAKDIPVGESYADNIAKKIIELRNSGVSFKEKSQINITLTGDEETNIFNNLMNNIVTQSDNFFIEVTGNAGKIKTKGIVVYNRKGQKILYWHEG